MPARGGKPLTGRFKGIRERTLKDGTKTYYARILKPKDRIISGDTPEKVLAGILAQSVEPGTVGEMVNAMIEHAKRLKWSRDPIRYQNEIRDRFGPTTLLYEITENEILDWRSSLEARNLSASSINNRLAQLKKGLGWAKEKGKLRSKPNIKKLADFGRRDLADVTASDIVESLIEHLWPPPFPHRAAILYCLFTGKRRSDLIQTKKNEMKSGKLHYRSSKNGKLLQLKVPDFLGEALEELARHQTSDALRSEYRFCKPDGIPYSLNGVGLQPGLDSACIAAGLPRITLHMVRHAAADSWARITGNPVAVKEIMGWSDIAMVYRYTHLDRVDESQVKQFEQLITGSDSSNFSPAQTQNLTFPEVIPAAPNTLELAAVLGGLDDHGRDVILRAIQSAGTILGTR